MAPDSLVSGATQIIAFATGLPSLIALSSYRSRKDGLLVATFDERLRNEFDLYMTFTSICLAYRVCS